MAVAGRRTRVVAGIFICGMLAVAGCGTQPARAPAVEKAGGALQAEPQDREVAGGGVHSTPYTTGRVPVAASRSEASSGDPTLQTADSAPGAAQETPDGVTTNGAVELALRFVPGQATVYRVTTEHHKSVEWKGSMAAKPAQFTDGRTGNRVELTFEQRVREVGEDGVAVLEVTIQGLKYVGEVVNKVVLDFESARPEDAGSPLAALIGKSYRVQMSPRGQVRAISGIEPLRRAMQGGLPAHRVAQRLLGEEEIRNRHEVTALSALRESSVRPGQTWSSIRSFSFADLGGKTYERIYTLRNVGCAVHTDSQDQEIAGGGVPGTPYEGRVAVVEMKAIPSVAPAEDHTPRPAVNPFTRMSDNTDRYVGRLVLDLDHGQVGEYCEEMQNEWIIVDPAALQTGEPAAIKMTARQRHRLERVP